jgi:hypothetical protein
VLRHPQHPRAQLFLKRVIEAGRLTVDD